MMKESAFDNSEIVKQFKLKDYKNTEFCKLGSRAECNAKRKERGLGPCQDVHFRKIINTHTDQSLGNCSYLDTCRHMDYCKFIHYVIEEQDERDNPNLEKQLIPELANRPKQWINCDLRNFDFTTLGECNVIMLDPPWDIHMNVVYCLILAALWHSKRQRNEKSKS